MSRLTLKEAISHAKEVAEENYRQGMLCHANPNDEELDKCIECGKEHEQLAGWLEELRRYKDLEEQGRLIEVIRCKNCIRHSDEYIAGADGISWCDEHEHLTDDDDYCSCAVAKLAEMDGAE